MKTGRVREKKMRRLYDIYQIPRNISTAEAENSEVFNNVGIPTPTPFPATLSAIYQNPYWVINRTHINENRDRIIGFLTAKFKITDWLSIAGRANLDKTLIMEKTRFQKGTILWSASGGNYAISEYYQYRKMV